MFITLSGSTREFRDSVAEALRDHFAYRGVAVYIYDLLTPVDDMVLSSSIAAESHNINFSKDRMMSLILQEGRKESEGFWGRAAMSYSKTITDKWDSLNMFYIAIMSSVMFKEDLNQFDVSFKVYLSDKSCAREDEFNDCAVSNIFDYVVDTNEQTPSGIANLIGERVASKISKAFSKE